MHEPPGSSPAGVNDQIVANGSPSGYTEALPKPMADWEIMKMRMPVR
jgi:hypothetical protein